MSRAESRPQALPTVTRLSRSKLCCSKRVCNPRSGVANPLRALNLDLLRLKNPVPVANLLGLLTVVLLTLTAPDMGLTWDEPAYMVASESYLAWFRQLARRPGFALSQEGIDR